jgi:hypothetical protein
VKSVNHSVKLIQETHNAERSHLEILNAKKKLLQEILINNAKTNHEIHNITQTHVLHKETAVIATDAAKLTLEPSCCICAIKAL